MEIIEKKSAGCFLISKIQDKFYVILQRKLWNNGRSGWVPPKGTIENMEDPKTAAIRETQEETGVKNFSIIEHLDNVEYSFEDGGKKYHKIVYWYLATATTQKLGLKKLTEHEKATQKEVAWIEVETAAKQMLFPEEENILRKIIIKLKNENFFNN